MKLFCFEKENNLQRCQGLEYKLCSEILFLLISSFMDIWLVVKVRMYRKSLSSFSN